MNLSQAHDAVMRIHHAGLDEYNTRSQMLGVLALLQQDSWAALEQQQKQQKREAEG
jgi:hypothetical protein